MRFGRSSGRHRIEVPACGPVRKLALVHNGVLIAAFHCDAYAHFGAVPVTRVLSRRKSWNLLLSNYAPRNVPLSLSSLDLATSRNNLRFERMTMAGLR
jgi:hypothetical protein